MAHPQVILERLQARDVREGIFHELILANNQLLQQAIENKKKDKKRKEELISEGSFQNVAELDRRIRELSEERAEMYKTQSENAQRLIHLSEQLRIKEDKEKRQTKELIQLSDQVKKLSAKCELHVYQLKEKDVTIQILQDELTALQLEITTTEEKNKNLSIENKQLLQRWMDLKNAEAEKMNEAMQFYEQALEQAKNSPDRKKSQPKETLSSYNLLPSKVYKKINAHDDDIHCIAASSKGALFATGGADRKIRLYDTRSGHMIQALGGALQTITSVSFNSTDEMILGSCTDNATRIWSLSTHRLRHTLTGHIGKVYAAKFTGDSNRVVSGSHDRTLKVWDLQRGYTVRTIFTFSSCNDLCLMDSDGQTLISGHLDNHIRFWDTRTGSGIKELTGVHNGQITSVSMSSDGMYLLTNSRDNTLKIIDIRMYDILKSFQADSYHNGLNWSRSTFSPSGSYIAAGSSDGTLFVWNVNTGKVERMLKEHRSAICGVSWNPTGDHIFSAEKNKAVCIWDTA
ncbi:hypothetical protein RMATCC62417_02245 [Rhizopus microsporus]|nr:hypothetical protein RMATCC62417_02245 [Rhizopus microsporus]